MGKKQPEQSTELAAPTPDTSGWYTRAQVATKLGIHISTVRRREDAGDFHPVVKGGVHYFDPVEVDSFREGNAEYAASEVLKSAVAIIKQQQDHNQKILEMSAGTAFKLLELADKTVGRMQERMKELEHTIDEQRTFKEKAESLEHERLLAQLRFESNQALKQAAFNALKTNFPSILALIATRKGNSTNVVESAIVQFVQGLRPEQIATILQSGALDAEQVTALGGILESASRPAAATPDPKQAA